MRIKYFLLSFCATFFLVALLFLFLMTTVHPKTAVLESEPESASAAEPYQPEAADALTVLFFGQESADSVAGTFLLAKFDPVRGGVTIAVFPPQTVIPGDGGGETLAEAFRYGGIRHTRDALSAYLGIPIDRTVTMDLAGFVAAAAAIGTVEFDLEQELVLTDGELTVRLNPGRQLLDGRTAAAVIRHRDYGGGELGRSRVVTRLACAIVNQRIDVVSSVLADTVFETVVNLVDTDISYADYIQRKPAAQAMAESGSEIAAGVSLEGSFSEDGERYSLYDTTLALLASRFS